MTNILGYISETVFVYMFRAIWEFARSRDCVAHPQNPKIAFPSWDYTTHVCNLKIAWFTCGIYELRTLPVSLTVSNLLCSSQDGRHPWNSCTVVVIHATRYTLAYHVPHAEHVESSIRQNGKARSRRSRAALRLFCSRVSERSKSHKLSPVTVILSFIPLLSS